MVEQVFPDAVQAVEYLKRRMVGQKARDQRQKFLEDHQRIHNRKMDEPCIPCLPGHDQEGWFAKLEVNGIWKRVFDFLTNPSDLTSAYFTCEMFRKHLEEKRKMMMLPKVLEVLRDTNHFQYRGFRFDSCCGPRSCRNADKKKAESKEVIMQRLISKHWKKSVEEALLVPVDVSQPESIWDLGGWFWELGHPMMCQFHSIADVERALANLRSPSSCASLIRFIDVRGRSRNDSDSEVFYSKLLEFLALHGESVWGIQFSDYDLKASKDFNYDGLCSIVSSLPQLKALWLEIDWDYEDRDDFGEGQPGQVEFKNANARLSTKIAQNPFPSLPELGCFSVSSWPAQHDVLVAEILSKNLNLKCVVLGQWDHFDHNHAIPLFVWDVLGNLQLKSFNFHYTSLGNHFEDFLRLRQFDWPLESLSVSDADYEVNEVEIGASNIFSVLSRFNDTLVEFELETTDIRLINDYESVVVDFPKLKEFDLPEIGDEN